MIMSTCAVTSLTNRLPDPNTYPANSITVDYVCKDTFSVKIETIEFIKMEVHDRESKSTYCIWSIKAEVFSSPKFRIIKT
jgi:hypothetical protein